jgi:hypothetical protein
MDLNYSRTKQLQKKKKKFLCERRSAARGLICPTFRKDANWAAKCHGERNWQFLKITTLEMAPAFQ